MDPLAPLKLGVRLGIEVLRFELRILEHILGLGEDREPEFAPPPTATAEPVRVPVQPDPAPPPPAPKPEQAIHVDTEPELVAESADPGAEDGAGAEIHVDEPWHGYRKMAASEIRDRVLVADTAELAVVQLYETMHRKRRTVLDAVERRSKELANAPSAR